MTATTAPDPTARPRTKPAVRTGLVLAVVLAVADVLAGITIISGDAAGTTIAVFGWVMAAATLAALPAGWRGAGWALRTVAVTRLLGGLTAVPAFFIDGIQAGLVLAATATVVGAVLVAVLVLSPRPVRS